ncbi:MAG TPA: hypothetical protein VIJ71_08220 [Mycobacteriales bacterium]
MSDPSTAEDADQVGAIGAGPAGLAAAFAWSGLLTAEDTSGGSPS